MLWPVDGTINILSSAAHIWILAECLMNRLSGEQVYCLNNVVKGSDGHDDQKAKMLQLSSRHLCTIVILRPPDL